MTSSVKELNRILDQRTALLTAYIHQLRAALGLKPGEVLPTKEKKL